MFGILRRRISNFVNCCVHRLDSSHRSSTMTTVSPFARSSAFDEPRLSGREQTVRIKIRDLTTRFKQRFFPLD